MPQMETIGGIAVIASRHVRQTKKRNATVTRKSSYASRFADKMCLRGGQERQVPQIREATGDCVSKCSCSLGRGGNLDIIRVVSPWRLFLNSSEQYFLYAVQFSLLF
jgi:hypothetical protein